MRDRGRRFSGRSWRAGSHLEWDARRPSSNSGARQSCRTPSAAWPRRSTNSFSTPTAIRPASRDSVSRSWLMGAMIWRVRWRVSPPCCPMPVNGDLPSWQRRRRTLRSFRPIWSSGSKQRSRPVCRPPSRRGQRGWSRCSGYGARGRPTRSPRLFRMASVRLHRVLGSIPHARVAFADPDAFTNVNTPEDLAIAATRLAAEAGG